MFLEHINDKHLAKRVFMEPNVLRTNSASRDKLQASVCSLYILLFFPSNHVAPHVAFYCGQPKAHLCNDHAV